MNDETLSADVDTKAEELDTVDALKEYVIDALSSADEVREVNSYLSRAYGQKRQY